MSLAVAAPSRSSGRRQALAALAYVVVVAGLCGAAFSLASGLADRSSAVTSAEERLAELAARARPGPTPPASSDALSAGSPFLEGQAITIAGAALQQRVDAAVAKAGGVVVSSQIALDGPDAKDGFVNLSENVEIAQPALQSLLYDLEAGMPYLYVDTLGVQSPEAFGEAETARMRVVLGVTGQWRPPQ